MCWTGKVGHETYHGASLAAARTRQRERGLKRPLWRLLEPYRCEECGQWHVGHRMLRRWLVGRENERRASA